MLVVWQDDVNKLVIGESYRCDKLTVRSFDGSKFLTPPKSGWTFERCDNVEVRDEDVMDPEDCDENEVILNTYVAGVMHVEMRVTCLSCKASFTSTGKLGKCTKCSMSQRFDRCCRSLTAKLLLTMEDNNSQFSHSLCVSSDN